MASAWPARSERLGRAFQRRIRAREIAERDPFAAAIPAGAVERQRLLEEGNRALRIAHVGMGAADVVEHDRLRSAIALRPAKRQRLLVVGESFSIVAATGFGQRHGAERFRLAALVGGGAPALEGLAEVFERAIGVAGVVVAEPDIGQRDAFTLQRSASTCQIGSAWR